MAASAGDSHDHASHRCCQSDEGDLADADAATCCSFCQAGTSLAKALSELLRTVLPSAETPEAGPASPWISAPSERLLRPPRIA
jgi:hypothetical protein